MIKPQIGTCSGCKQNTEIWEGYNDSCADCFNKAHPSKFTIDGVPIVRVIEDLLMERPIVRKIIETAMIERGAHRIIRLEEDGRIYKVDPEFHEQIKKEPQRTQNSNIARANVHPADPELISKLNGLIDEHISNCNYCQCIIDENSVL